VQLVRWNKNHETLLGYENHELQNWKVTDWIDSKTRDYMLEAAEKIIDQGPFVFEDELLTKDRPSNSIYFKWNPVRPSG